MYLVNAKLLRRKSPATVVAKSVTFRANAPTQALVVVEVEA